MANTSETTPEMAILQMLKTDLGIITTAYDTRLAQLIEAAEKYIEAEGAMLDLDSIDDAQLVKMYADYLWRRRDSQAGMPRMLRFALNNKVLGQKAGDADG